MVSFWCALRKGQCEICG